MKKFYAGWGSALLLVFTGFTYVGWSFPPAVNAKADPKSVRDNPGTYRTHYTGGK
jgi:hypothetical protein